MVKLDDTVSLPPQWRIDATLKGVIPSPHDYRTFTRLPENRDRYALDIMGHGIYDIHYRRFLSPFDPDTEPRRRFRLNQGPHTRAVVRTYARLICFHVYGPPPVPPKRPQRRPKTGTRRQQRSRASEAHHVDTDVTNDVWTNLRWQSPEANKSIERNRRRQTGINNGRAKLTYDQIFDIVGEWACATAFGGSVADFDVAGVAGKYAITPSYLHRLLKGQARKDDVQRAFAEQNLELPR